jgi:DNA modification methylase
MGGGGGGGTWQIERRSIAELSNDPANARKHNDKNIEAIIASLRRFGQQKPIVIDRNNIVRAGNGTLEAARRLGWDSIDCVKTSLEGSDAIAYAIADNRTAELAEWDDDALAAQLNGLLTESEEIALAAGFTDEELAELLAGEVDDSETIEDEAPSAPKVAVSKLGDIWLLGDHKVGCGSCTDLDFVGKVFDGEYADMMFTDPPYNVAYEGKTKDKLVIKNDSMKDGDFLQFLRDVFSSLATVVAPGGAAYVCHADVECANFCMAFADAGWDLKQYIIWVKNCLVLGRKDYQSRHEPILYGWRSGASHRFYGNRKNTTVIDDFEGVTVAESDGEQLITIAFNGRTVQIKAPTCSVIYDGSDELDTVWRFNKPSRNQEHPTMKPIALCARGIRHGSKKGDLVVDGFLGSGSTLIACEQLGRRCYGFEIDPIYCDVIVKRWETLTGNKAVLEQ